MKVCRALILSLLFGLMLVSLASAAYTGPNRRVRNPADDYVRMQYQAGYNPYNVQICTFDTNCATIPSREQQHYWCSGTYVLYPSGYCATHLADCWQGRITETYCAYDDLPEATASGSLTCAVPGDNGWCRGGAEASFSAHEPLSGERIRYFEGTLGAGLFTVCDPADAADVACSWTPPEGLATLNFWAHSSYGDTSRQSSLACQVDTVAPTTSLQLSDPPNANGWYRGAVTLSASGTDATSGVSASYVQVDGGALQPSPLTLSADGLYIVRAAARDLAGNQGASAEQTVRLDSTAPYDYDFLPERPPDDGRQWYTAPVTVNAYGYDALSGFDYASYLWLGDEGLIQSGVLPLSVDREGSNDLNPCVYDRAGNNLCGGGTIDLDLSPPSAVPQISGPLGLEDWYIGAVQLDVQAADAASGVRVRSVNVDNSGWQDLPSGLPLLYSSQGSHTFTARAEDRVGRLSPVSAALPFKIDSHTPLLETLIPSPGGENGWHLAPVEVRVSASDATSGLQLAQVQVDGGAWQDGGTILSTEGRFSLGFRAQDRAGNQSAATATVSVDLNDPQLSITTIGLAGSAGWYRGPVTLQAAASDSASGLREILARQAGGEWSPQDSLTLAEDGIFTLEFLARDQAGRETSIQQQVKIDASAPTLAPTASGTIGWNGWYTSPVTLNAHAFDAISGIAQVQPEPERIVASDGLHTVLWQAWDVAGNTSAASLTVGIDQIPPTLTLDALPPVLSGEVLLSGSCMDATSGLATVEASTSLGLVWQKVTLGADGSWSLPWDTRSLPGGTVLLQARAFDLAGNRSQVALSVTLSNRAPSLQMTERWYIWESGQIQILPGDVDWDSLTVTIRDPLGRWPEAVLRFSPASLQSGLVTWDRRFGAVIAPIGEYPVTAVLVDALGRRAEASGVILIPADPTPTLTPQASATATQLPTRTPAAVEATAQLPSPTAAALQPTPQATGAPKDPQVLVKAPTPPAALFPWWAVIFIGGCFALGVSLERDPRPRELRKLSTRMAALRDLHFGKREE